MSNKTNRLNKKNSTKNPKYKDGSNLVLLSHIKEGSLIILFGISIFFLIAFFTYHPFDAGWSRTAQHLKNSNVAGSLGAWCADLFLYFFGIAAYILPLTMLYNCFVLLLNKKQDTSLLLWSIKVFGLITTILSGSGLISLFCNNKIINLNLIMPLSIGGLLGDLLSGYFSYHANFWGAVVILIPCMLAGITAMTGISWIKSIKIINFLVNKTFVTVSKKIIRIFNNTNNIIKLLIQKILEINKKRGAIKKSSTTNKFIKIINKSNEHSLEQPKMFKKHFDIFKKTRADEHEKKELTPTSFVNKQQVQPEKLIAQNQYNHKEQYDAAKNFIKQIKNKNNNGSLPKNNNKPFNSSSNLPSLNLLEGSNNEELKYTSDNLPDPTNIQAKLADFGIAAQITEIFPGPVVTRVEMELAPGTKASKITTLAKDLARSLSVPSVRVVEVIPGKSVIGLEIPNKKRALVRLREVLASEQYLTSNSPLTLALGKDIAGIPTVTDLSRMPHLLVAGTTGSGKSVGVNAMLLSILFKATPNEVRLILIDPKMLELSIYEGIPHLLTPVVTDMKDAANVLNWCVYEMERRYKLMANIGVRNLLSFNHKVQSAYNLGNPIQNPFYNAAIPEDHLKNKKVLEKLPLIVVIIDEFADMMMVVGKKVEEQISRIAQKARAAGIHMILATQRPSVDVITGLIKANIPTRISFQVSSRIDSRTILDQQGAEQLLGNGDLLYLPPGSGIPVRVHGAFVSDEEVHRVVSMLKENNVNTENQQFMININQIQNIEVPTGSDLYNDNDPLYNEALAIVTTSRKASISYLQRRLKIGFNRAARLIEELQDNGVVSSTQHNGMREVLVPASPEC